MWWNLLAVLTLLAANAFFVAAEFALVKARRFRIQALADDGQRTAAMTIRILDNLEAHLAACQLGITMASLGLGWVGEPAVAALLEPAFRAMGLPDALLHTTAFVIGFLLFSSLHIVVGEQVPKTFAIRRADSVATASAYPLRAAYLAVWPLNAALNWVSGAVLRVLGVEEASHLEVYSSEELKGMVANSGEQGELREASATMVKNVLEFDERLVGRVMIPRGSTATLDLQADPAVNLKTLKTEPHSRFPLLNSGADDEVVGLVLAKDVYKAILEAEPDPFDRLRDFAREPLVVPETQRISALFELMRSKRAHMAFVVDEYGSFVGVVTLEDLIEEIVGEIQDETDTAEPDVGVYPQPDGSWEVNGLASLGDVEREIGIRIPADLDANTVSGLFLRRLARMPVVGDVIEEPSHRLEVLSIEGRHVQRVRITALAAL